MSFKHTALIGAIAALASVCGCNGKADVPFIMGQTSPSKDFQAEFIGDMKQWFKDTSWKFFGEERYKQSQFGGEFSYYTEADQAHCLDKAAVCVSNTGVAPIYRDAYVAVGGIGGNYSLRSLMPGTQKWIEIDGIDPSNATTWSQASTSTSTLKSDKLYLCCHV